MIHSQETQTGGIGCLFLSICTCFGGDSSASSSCLEPEHVMSCRNKTRDTGIVMLPPGMSVDIKLCL